MSEKPSASRQSLRALDGVNFCLADVMLGIGPFTAAYLQADRHWDPARVGAVISASGLAAVLVQAPAGAIIDAVRRKRELLAGVALLIAAAGLATLCFRSFAGVVACQAVVGAAGAFLAPTLAAITLGLVGHGKFDLRMGRNQAVNHAGTVAAALMAGLLGYLATQAAVYWLVGLMCLLSVACLAFLRADEIDFDLSRGGDGHRGGEMRRLGKLFRDRRLRVLAASFFLFHLANGAMLPLVGEHLSEGDLRRSTLFMGAAVLVAQAVMIPAAWFSARWVGRVGRKTVLLAGFCCLPLRGLLFALDGHPAYLLSVQALDGIGAGIFGVVWVIMVADLAKGSGCFNAAQGVVATVWGLGAALSPLLGGWMAKELGFRAAFLALAALGTVAAAFFALCMTETKKRGAAGISGDARKRDGVP